MKHAYRDLAAAKLDELEELVRSSRAAEEAAIMGCGPLPVDRREAWKVRRIGPFVGPILPKQKRDAAGNVLELVQVVADAPVHHRAKQAGDELEATIRSSRLHWLSRRVAVAAVKRANRAGGDRTPWVSVPAHARVITGAVTSSLPADPATLSLTSQQTAKRCQKSHIYVACGCGSQLIPRGCGSSDCVDCTEEVAARRSRRAAERIEHGMWGREAVVHRVILTLPPEVRSRYLDPAAWRELGRAAARMLRGNPLHLRFMCEATHPVGDQDPGEFHPHFNFVGVQPRGFRFFLSHKQIQRLRVAWARLLELDPHDVNPPELSFYRPRGTPGQAALFRHSLRYTMRPFPGWSAWLPSVRWFGPYPRCPEGERWFESFCPTCGAAYWIRAAGDAAVKLAFLELHAAGYDAAGLRINGPPLVLEPLDIEPGTFG